MLTLTIACMKCYIIALSLLLTYVVWKMFKNPKKERVFIKKESDGIDWGIDDIK